MYMKTTAISITNLTVGYQKKSVLRNITLDFQSGILVGIVGPNGAGKTTFIKSILDLIKPKTGTIAIFGAPYQKNKVAIAYVPQRSTVDWDFPATVFDVVIMGRYGTIGWFASPGKNDVDAALHAIDQVGLTAYADCSINQLSGGQQQRVFLARALVQNAQIYLMDEPFAGVDATTEKTIIAILKKLRDQGKTIIVVHHDLQTIHHYFDWLLLLNKECIAYGPVETVFTPENITKTYSAQATRSDMQD